VTIEIREHVPGKDLNDFVRAAHVVFRDDPAWVAPLDFMIKEQLTPKTNPFFGHADVTLFTAWKDGELVGRTSAQIDHEHLKRWNDDTGFFGFFDTIDDEEVARALVSRAEQWLRERGMKRMRGPMSMSINEELGLLVDGFDTPPMIMMSHSRSYQQRLAEACGLEKVKDLLAWRYDVGDLPPRALRAHEQIVAMPEVEMRTLKKAHLDAELALVLEIQDDAWRDNWGHVSLTPDEAKKAAEGLKLVLNDEMAIMAEIDGEPAGMCIAIPNLYEAIADLDGKLLPLGWAKLLWRLKVKGTKTARLFLLGIKAKYRGVKRYGGLAMAMIAEIATRGRRLGIEWGELSWTLEDNAPVNVAIRAVRGRVYKTYRIYEKPL
jgi:hypothetical protein